MCLINRRDDTETMDTRHLKVWSKMSHSNLILGKSVISEETLLALILKTALYTTWCRHPGDGCSGEHSTNGPQLTGLDSVTPYSLTDLKYSSQHSCLSINIYFNKHYTQSPHGAATFTVAFSFNLKVKFITFCVHIASGLCSLLFACCI